MSKLPGGLQQLAWPHLWSTIIYIRNKIDSGLKPLCTVYLINSEQFGVSEQFCDDQKVPYYQVWLHQKMS